MEKLQEIFDELVDVEYGMKSLVLVLKVLADQYDLEYKKEVCAVLEVIIRQMESLQMDLEKELDRIDQLLAAA